MRTLNRLLLLLLAFCLGTASVALAAKEKERDKEKKRPATTSNASAAKTSSLPDPGSCTLGSAQKDLDVNNVRSRVYNTGSLAYGNGNSAQYVVPKAAEYSPIFAHGIWIGGQVNGDLRVAGATYQDFEFWPGPLGADGRPVNPSNCSAYDRVWKVDRQDILNYEGGSSATPDLAEWPFDLGAPVIDGDGDPNNYNLAGGDRPDLIGDQAVWWVMNDVGNAHNNTETPPIGIEVRVHGFAFNRADALGNTTFYKYTVIYKGEQPLTNAYFSIFSDPDLGDATDDYVGVDTTLSLGFVYNANPTDDVYGPAPAVGYDFFQGPVVDGDTLGVSSFFYFINGGPAGTEDPSIGEHFYNIMQGFWRGGQPLTARGLGFNTDGPVTKFAYPGDPVTGQYWSEVNVDGSGARNTPGDRRLVMTTGPFTINPGDRQDIVFGVVFAQAADNLSSVAALRSADILAQAAYDADFIIPSPPPSPPLCDANSPNPQLRPGTGNCLYATEMDGEVILSWGYPSNSSNYLGGFDVFDPFLANLGLEDTTYTFEGFNIYRYPTSALANDQAQHVATFDLINGITKVTDPVFDADVGDFVQKVSARGSDSGLQYTFHIPNLTNYTDYYYGVSAYAYSPNSTPKVLESSPTKITVRPARLDATGTTTRTDIQGADSSATVVVQNGQGVISYRIVDPAALTGSTYRIEFYDLAGVTGPGGESGAGVTAFDIIRESDGAKLLDGRAYFTRTGQAPPQQADVLVADGISFSVAGPPKRFDFIGQALPDGRFLPMIGDANFGLNASATLLGAANAALANPRFFITAQGSSSPFTGTRARIDWLGRIQDRAPIDYEIRFVDPSQGGGQVILNRVWDLENPDDAFMHGWTVADPENPVDDPDAPTAINEVRIDAPGKRMPFEVWEIYPDGTERQVIAAILDDDGDGYWDFNTAFAGETHGNGFGGYERIYAADVPYPGHEAALADPYGFDDLYWGDYTHTSTIGRLVIVPYPGTGDYAEIPAPGVVLRLVTSKPNLAGDIFRVSTEGLNPEVADLTEETLESIGIVPNPYRGQSAYEVGNLDRRVRFVNLPEQATIRVYTVSGTLIRTLRKDGPGRSLDWNLTTDNNLPIASGMYFVHVDVPGVGERVLKFGCVNRDVDINIF